MARRLAFLIGNESFAPEAGLGSLAGPRNDAAALEAVLQDPGRGDFKVTTLLDQPRGVVMPALDMALGTAEPGDLVLLFYAGHGKLDHGGRLCLAVADTRTSALYSTSIPAAELRNLIANSNCGQVVLLLDCCYSGAAGREFVRGTVEDQLSLMREAQGLHLLTASTNYQTARELETEAGGVVMGKFTRAITEGIATGAADHDRDGLVTLSDLRQHLARTVRGQTPQYWAQEAAGDPVIARAGPAETSAQRRLHRLGAWYADGRISESLYLEIAAAAGETGNAARAALVQPLLDNPRTTVEALLGAWEGAIRRQRRPNPKTAAPPENRPDDVADATLPPPPERVQRQISREAAGRTAAPGDSPLSPGELKRLEIELARHIGPLARVLINRALPAPSVAALWRSVAGHIDDSGARAAFLQKAPLRQDSGAG